MKFCKISLFCLTNFTEKDSILAKETCIVYIIHNLQSSSFILLSNQFNKTIQWAKN